MGGVEETAEEKREDREEVTREEVRESGGELVTIVLVTHRPKQPI
jgi:hypothetical protein